MKKSFRRNDLARKLARAWVETKNRGLKMGEILGALTY
jgi:hypothetical protein